MGWFMVDVKWMITWMIWTCVICVLVGVLIRLWDDYGPRWKP